MSKKQRSAQLQQHLFESKSEENREQVSQSSTSIAKESSPLVDPTACPRCGSRSQKTAHPVEHGGKTRYCTVCLSEDKMDLYYFSPVEETPF